MKQKNLIRIISIILCFIVALLFTIVFHIKFSYGKISIDQILYNIKLDDSSLNSFLGIINKTVLPLIFFFFIIISPLFLPEFKTLNKLTVSLKKPEKKYCLSLNFIKKIKQNFLLYSIFMIFVVSLYGFYSLSLFEYILSNYHSSTFFEENYIAPESTNIKFPDSKKNLILIHLESMENTILSTENGGAWNYSLIPELEKIAQENINFSFTDNVGGFPKTYGSTWTIAGMVSQSAGIPLKIPINGNEVGKYSGFLPGSYTLGDILKNEGYNQTLLLGSNASFGSRSNYYKDHGNYNILDYQVALEKGLIDEDYYVWWGYEDAKLYEFAKSELIRLSSEENEPFNFTMLTADTHYFDGYLDRSCPLPYLSKYENVFSCSSLMLNDFILWIKSQSFYKNTTIVITGDHLAMQQDFFDNISDNYERTVYNAFINSGNNSNRTRNRSFNAFDIFPTIIASIGGEIEGERLGLGTNLFSQEDTLSEKYGYNFINKELSYKSEFYNKKILGNTYFEMVNDKNSTAINKDLQQ